MNRQVLIVLALLSLSAGTFAAPAGAASSQPVAVAFQGTTAGSSCNPWSWIGFPGQTTEGIPEPGLTSSGCVTMAGGTSPSEVVTNPPDGGSTAVAFQGSNGMLWIWRGVPGNLGTEVNEGMPMKPGTSPSITLDTNGQLVVAFQGSNGHLWTWTAEPGFAGAGTDTGLGMASGTSPSIAFTGGGVAEAAFQADTGFLWTWDGRPATVGGGGDTFLGMAPGTSPSITSGGPSDAIATVAFQAQSSDFLWTWSGFTGFSEQTTAAGSTGLGMPLGTSPSITTLPSGKIAVAFQANTGDLYTWTGVGGTPGSFADAHLGMAAGTSPAISALASGQAAAAFQANTGDLYTWIGKVGSLGTGRPGGCYPNLNCAQLQPMASRTSPSIVTEPPVPGGLSITAKGNILARLHKPRTLVLLVYLRRKPRTPQKLLGRVALGHHHAGLSPIKWGLPVRGHRLGAGHYLAELEASTDGVLTVGGPTVSFNIGNSGKLTIVGQSCSARSPAC